MSYTPESLVTLSEKALKHLERKIDEGSATAADLGVLARLLSELNVLKMQAVAAEPESPKKLAAILPFPTPIKEPNDNLR